MLEFLKTVQSYLNRYINASELVEALKQIDTSGMPIDEQSDYLVLISRIQDAIAETDDKKDRLVNEEFAQLESSIKRMETIKQKTQNLPKEIEDYIERLYKKRTIARDNLRRWRKVGGILKESAYYRRVFSALSDFELLELIAADMRATYPVDIDRDRYNALVKVGIGWDKREWLWRLAFNYLKEPYDISPIAKYYLDMDDSYYLTELISIAGEKLDIDDIIAEVEKKDKKFIADFLQAEQIMNEYINEKQFKNLRARVD